MSDRTAARRGTAGAPEGLGGWPARVLVVDAAPAPRGRVTAALRDAGHEVVAAPDGTTALGLVGAHWQPDLLLLGARLPDLDAPAFLRAYAQTPGLHAPVVLVTAAPAAMAPLRSGPVPIAAVLPAPVDLDELVAVVAAHRPPTPGRPGLRTGVP